ncbi:hypothetical protein LI291_10695 [Intestinibacillus massiliensis]|nr:hypothetical protein [Intestinibacillus massiliensis]
MTMAGKRIEYDEGFMKLIIQYNMCGGMTAAQAAEVLEMGMTTFKALKRKFCAEMRYNIEWQLDVQYSGKGLPGTAKDRIGGFYYGAQKN